MHKIINGTYEIDGEPIGKGGMSAVYKARQIRLNTIWAVKVIRRDNVHGVDLLAEADILKRLNHPNIAKIVDISEDDENIYIIEEFVEGRTLQYIIDCKQNVPEKTLIFWYKQLAEILRYLHGQTPRPIIYRDMKPSNVMVHEGNVKLIDFGIAREYKFGSGKDTVDIGTMGFAAPEQFGKGQSDARTDIYSLGATMFYMATLEIPAGITPTVDLIQQYNPNISKGLAEIIVKSMNRDPYERFQSADELLVALNRLDERNAEPRRNTFYLDAEEKPKRSKFPLIVIGVFAIAFIISLTIFWLNNHEKDEDTEAVATTTPTVEAEATATPSAIASVEAVETEEPELIGEAFNEPQFIGECFTTSYLSFLDSINAGGDTSRLVNVSDSQAAIFQSNYPTNTQYTFLCQEIVFDNNSLTTSEADGWTLCDFHVRVTNLRTTKSTGEQTIVQPVIIVQLKYQKETKAWELEYQNGDDNYSLSSNLTVIYSSSN